MKKINVDYQESTSFFKKNTPDFCEGCVVHGLYKKEIDGCIYCRNRILVNNKNKKLKFNKYISYYDSLFSAVSLKYQSNSSAGGFVTDLLENLLKKNIVDSVISVAFDKKTQIFRYKEFSKYSSLADQQQSVYTKVNLNDALKIILSKNKTFAITATPIACKILRMYQKKNNVIKKRLKFIVGLVSGGYKNNQYIPYNFYIKKRVMFDKFESIRFRYKGLIKKYAGDSYYFSATNKTEIFTLKSGEVIGNWPLGLFKYFASDFCSDTFNKYSDITVMDGWCKKFIKTKGVSLVISINIFLTNIIKKKYKLCIGERKHSDYCILSVWRI